MPKRIALAQGSHRASKAFVVHAAHDRFTAIDDEEGRADVRLTAQCSTGGHMVFARKCRDRGKIPHRRDSGKACLSKGDLRDPCRLTCPAVRHTSAGSSSLQHVSAWADDLSRRRRESNIQPDTAHAELLQERRTMTLNHSARLALAHTITAHFSARHRTALAGLYGSAARNTDTPWSDLELLFVVAGERACDGH